MKIKVCGMRDPGNVKEVAGLSPDYLGFIFYPGSKRFVGEKIADLVHSYIPREIKKVGVFVEESFDNVMQACAENDLDMVQLHGNENPGYCSRLRTTGIEVIKAFNIGDDFNFSRLQDYVECCDYFLFDTKGDKPGGTGKKFNWELLGEYKNEVPFFLSGGIGVDDIGDIKDFSHPMLHAVDINSRFETEPGVKDVNLLRRFIENIR